MELTHLDFSGDGGLKFFLSYFNSNPDMALSRFFGRSGFLSRVSLLFADLNLRRVYTDVVGKHLIFLSAGRFDFYHEKLIYRLSSVAINLEIFLVCDSSESRYSSYDLEINGLNVEFESGLKTSYRDLKDRII